MTALPVPSSGSVRETSPKLQPVPTRRRTMANVSFMLVLALVLALGMVGVLVLNTALQNQAFAVQSKQHEANELGYRLSDLQARVAQARSASSLAIRAQELGMKPDPYQAQLRLPDGTVVGNQTKVNGAEMPSVRYLTPEQAAAEQEARDKALAKAKAKAKAEAEAQAKAEAEAKARAEADAAASAERQANR